MKKSSIAPTNVVKESKMNGERESDLSLFLLSNCRRVHKRLVYRMRLTGTTKDLRGPVKIYGIKEVFERMKIKV